MKGLRVLGVALVELVVVLALALWWRRPRPPAETVH